MNKLKNYDKKVVKDFGSQWGLFRQNISDEELKKYFDQYFKLFPWESISKESVGFDMGCGSGRWAKFVAPHVKNLTCIDPSFKALESAKFNLKHLSNVNFVCGTTEESTLRNESQDFGYSLGVLHHIPDTQKGLKDCVSKLKKGGYMLVYLYFDLENKSKLYKLIWRISNLFRKIISKLPFIFKVPITSLIAIFVYLPLSKLALNLEKLNLDISNIPLAEYRRKSFYVMLTDSLDRFGTKLEKRFSKKEVYNLMHNSGLEKIKISEKAPYWLAIGEKK